MIEKLIIDYLSEHLEVFVGMEAPEQTTNYVLLDKTGSSRNNLIITSTIAIQSYGPSLYAAMDLNAQVEETMEGLLELNRITRVELETDYNYTNTACQRYCFVTVFVKL